MSKAAADPPGTLFGVGTVVALVFLLAVLVACGRGSLSLQEYGDEAELLVREVTVRIDALDAELDSSATSSDDARSYWIRRLDARSEFLDGLVSLDPPDEAVELHGIAVDLFGRLNAAEEALAVRVETLEAGSTPELWWDTPEGRVARAVDEEVTSICHVAQAGFDETKERAVLADTPWIPPEMKEVARVAFGCSE